MDDFDNNSNQASQAHKRFFFKIVAKAGIDSEQAKDRAKEKFKLDSFADISTKQLNVLVKAVKDKLAKEEIIRILDDYVLTNQEKKRIATRLTASLTIEPSISNTRPN